MPDLDELEFDLSEAHRFIDLLAEDAPVCFQTFNDRKDRTAPLAASKFHATLDDAIPKLIQHNRNGNGVYVTVNETDGRGRSAANITRIRALFLDLDGAPIDPVYATGLEPHLVVESSPGRFQVYWFVDDCPVDRFRILQRALAKKFNGDKSVSDPSRVMRVPGFYHHKGDPFRSRLLHAEVFRPYPVQGVIDAFELEVVESPDRLDTAATSADTPPPPQEQIRHWPVEEARKLLTVLSPDCDRYTWLRVGMALHAQYSGSEGFELWDTWSKGCPKRYNAADIIRDWKSFKPGRVTFATLVHMAVEAGYQGEFPVDASLPAVEIDLSSRPLKTETTAQHVHIDTTPLPKDLVAPTPMMALPLSVLESAPGVVGELTAWLTEVNFYRQPAYSLASALSFVGFLKGHQYRTESNARTNLLTIAIGPASSGKSTPTSRIKEVAAALGLSDESLIGDPKSDTAMLTALQKAGGKTWFPWEEAGLALKQLTSPRAAGFQASLLTVIMRLYSEANTKFLGYQYANQKENPRVDIDQPCLCMYGTSTPEGLFDSLTSAHAVNGFASRILVFESHDYLAPKRRNAVDPTPPAELIRHLRQYFPGARQGGNLAHLTGPVINPVVVPYTDDARALLDEAIDFFEGKKREAICRRLEADESIWGRAAEHVQKVALTVETSARIRAETVRWSVELLTRLCSNFVLVLRDRIADNENHKLMNQVLKVIREAGAEGIAHWKLGRRTRAVSNMQRKQILAALLEEGTIRQLTEGTDGRSIVRYAMSGISDE